MSSGKRGSVSRRGVRLRGVGSDEDLNMWEGGESSGDNVGDRSAGSIRRRDRDTRRVRERGGRLGAVTWDPGDQEGEGDHKEGLAWDLCHFNFSAL